MAETIRLNVELPISELSRVPDIVKILTAGDFRWPLDGIVLFGHPPHAAIFAIRRKRSITLRLTTTPEPSPYE